MKYVIIPNKIKVTGIFMVLLLAVATICASMSHAEGNKTAEDYFNEGLEFHTNRKFPEAIVVYTKALEMRPKFIEALFGRGASFALADHADKAMADFDMIIAINPAEEQAYYNKAMIFQIYSSWGEAIKQFELFLGHATFKTHPDQIRDVKRLIKKNKTKIIAEKAQKDRARIKKAQDAKKNKAKAAKIKDGPDTKEEE